MSNLFKSKFLLVGMLVLLAFVVTTSSADAAITSTLRKGSRGAQVLELQKSLGVTPATGYFGSITLAAVKAWQTSKGLTPDGIFGPASRSAYVASGSVSGQFPAGCQSAAGYSPTTGAKCDSLGSTGTPVTTGPVTVALSADTPASGSVVSPSTGAVFAKYVFTGNGTVTSLKLMRTGISANTSLPNIYLYDGAVRLTDAASLNSDNTATFNATGGLFSVTGTKVISVVADVTGSDYSAGLTLVSVTSGGVVTPMSLAGNVQYIAVATLATVDFGTVTPTGGSLDPAKDVVVFQSSVNIGARDVSFSRLAMRQIGSVNTSDIANFRLMIDGATVATVANMDSSGYVTFSLPVAKTLTTGTRVFKVLADVNGGSSRNFQFSIRNKTDVGFLDTSYNAGISATFSTGNFPASPVAATSINAGTVTVQKASDSPSGNTIVNGNDVVLARYTLTTYGESLKIEQVKAAVTASDGSTASLRNGRIMINGAQVGSTATLAVAGTTYTTNYTLVAGMPATLEIRADIFDNDGTNNVTAGDTFIGVLKSLASNTQRLTSLGYITVPAADINGNTLTAQSAASVTMAKTATYANQTTAVPQTSPYKIASYTLSGSNVEEVNLDTVSVDFTAVAGTTFTAADLTDVMLKIDGAVIGSPKGTVAATGNTFSITKTLVKNGSMTIELWATIGSTITATDSIKSTTTVSGVGASSAVASTTGAVDSQTIVANTGSITVTLDASRPDPANNDDSGTKTMAAFKFAAVTDSYTVTELVLTVADITTVSTVRLFDGATEIASKAAAATTTFYGLSWPVPAGQSKILTVKLDLGTVGVGAGTTGAATTVALVGGSTLATNGAGVSAAISGGTVTAQVQYTYKAIPTISLVTLPTTALGNGTQTLAKFSVNTNGTGTIAWKQVLVTIAKTGGAADGGGTDPLLASPTLWDADTNTQITAAAVFTSTDGDAAGTDTTANCEEIDTACTLLLTVGADSDDNVEQQVAGAKTYEVRATVNGTLATSDYISTNFTRPSSHITSNVFTTAETSSPSFVWSDMSASSHDTGTTDWTNDYLVKNLPTNTQTLTK